MIHHFQWNPPEGPPTLEAITSFIRSVVHDLDPSSRYISELLEVLHSSRNAADFFARLDEHGEVAELRDPERPPSDAQRGRAWVPEEVWRGMSQFERVLANLVTSESWFITSRTSAEFALLCDLLPHICSLNVLSVPCAMGQEAYSLAILGRKCGVRLEITAVDRQPSIVSYARLGHLPRYSVADRLNELEQFVCQCQHQSMLQVSDEIRQQCTFQVGDVLSGDLPNDVYSLVVCRNFLGYFCGRALHNALRNVLAHVAPAGLLLLDRYVTTYAETAPIVQEVLSTGGMVSVQHPLPLYCRAASNRGGCDYPAMFRAKRNAR